MAIKFNTILGYDDLQFAQKIMKGLDGDITLNHHDDDGTHDFQFVSTVSDMKVLLLPGMQKAAVVAALPNGGYDVQKGALLESVSNLELVQIKQRIDAAASFDMDNLPLPGQVTSEIPFEPETPTPEPEQPSDAILTQEELQMLMSPMGSEPEQEEEKQQVVGVEFPENTVQRAFGINPNEAVDLFFEGVQEGAVDVYRNVKKPEYFLFSYKEEMFNVNVLNNTDHTRISVLHKCQDAPIISVLYFDRNTAAVKTAAGTVTDPSNALKLIAIVEGETV